MSAKNPNVILIVADDLGYGDLGCYGNSDLDTPHIDQLAARGILLENHYSASPLCAPARAALLTGRYNHRTGAVDVSSNRGIDRISLEEKTLAEAMKEAGYTTKMVGKWHNGLHDIRHHPNARGFDHFVGFLNGAMDYYDWVLDYNGKPVSSDGRYLTDVFTQESINFINDYSEEPFFLYLAYNVPHNPLQAPEELVKKYKDKDKFNDTVSTIYAMIEKMDEGIGKIVNELKQKDILDDTLIIFTSDNGPVLRNDYDRYNRGLKGQKDDALEGGIKVPAIISWPDNLPQGICLDNLIHFTDWFPSIYSVTGQSIIQKIELDGNNILPLLKGKYTTNNQVRYWQKNRYKPIPYCICCYA